MSTNRIDRSTLVVASQNIANEGREAMTGQSSGRGRLEGQVSTERYSTRTRNMQTYLSGQALIGDDFSDEEIAQWFADEKEACYEIRGGMTTYPYHAKNWFHGYRKLSQRVFQNVLSFGGGNGAELLPMADRLGHITILESSDNFKPVVKARYAPASLTGVLAFPDGVFDLVTCLGVLHHIPNVSTVIKELYRCTAQGGILLISEPTISMGCWTAPRAGLTKHERGIPLHLLRSFVTGAGFQIISESRCSFAPINYVARKLDLRPYNSRAVVLLDHFLCKLPVWSSKYHSTAGIDKMRPTAVFYVLTK